MGSLSIARARALALLPLLLALPAAGAGRQTEADPGEQALYHISMALESGGKLSGRVYYRAARCDAPFSAVFPGAPPVTYLPRAELKGVEAVRDVLRNESGATVVKEPSGLVRIRLGVQAPDPLLATHISRLNFGADERYNADLAVLAIGNAPEVRAAARALGADNRVTIVSILFASPAPGMPHLPQPVKNLTLDQALDAVATKFHVNVVYVSCDSPRQYEIRVWPVDGARLSYENDAAWRSRKVP